MEGIGSKIRDLRKNKCLTQEELAELAKINLRTIQHIENSKSIPRGKTLNLICEALDINTEDIIVHQNEEKKTGSFIINLFFLIILNLVLVSIVGFLTIDSEANLNSRLAAYLLSFFMSFFIVFKTQKMNADERLLKFGFGFISYFIAMLIIHGFSQGVILGFLTALFPCLAIALSILYYGNRILNYQNPL